MAVRLLSALLVVVHVSALLAPRVSRRATSLRSAADEAQKPYTLYDVPVSNNGARVRMVVYYTESEGCVEILSPAALGGLNSEEYKAVHSEGKMPALVRNADGLKIPESDTIARFLGGKFGAPTNFAPAPGSELAVLADRIARHHDAYLAPIQGVLYKASPKGQGYAVYGSRDAALDAFEQRILDVERYVDGGGPYLVGGEPTHADAALFPTLVFADFMLPQFGRKLELGPETRKWFDYMCGGDDAVGARVRDEIVTSLEKWAAGGRWAKIFGAGIVDDAAPTVFDKIIAGEIPAEVVYEDDLCVAFKDANPAAPVHALLIPKKRTGLTRLREATDEQAALLGHLMATAGTVAEAAGLGDYRVVVNDGESAGQTVFHLHLHILGGRDLAWPPG